MRPEETEQVSGRMRERVKQVGTEANQGTDEGRVRQRRGGGMGSGTLSNISKEMKELGGMASVEATRNMQPWSPRSTLHKCRGHCAILRRFLTIPVQRTMTTGG